MIFDKEKKKKLNWNFKLFTRVSMAYAKLTMIIVSFFPARLLYAGKAFQSFE